MDERSRNGIFFKGTNKEYTMNDSLKRNELDELLGEKVIIRDPTKPDWRFFGWLESYNDKELFVRSDFKDADGNQPLETFPRGFFRITKHDGRRR